MDAKTYHLTKIGIVANIFEWYEFTTFVFLSGLIGQLFFKSTDPIIGLMQSFLIFALSFITRPLGGLFFGLIGDRIGRGFALNLSLVLMSVPTVLIGLLPTYDRTGIMATASLLVLRLIQGFSAGGELPTTACYMFESSDTWNRSLLCSLIVASPKIGMLLASFVTSLLFYYFDQTTLLAWAWRIPFLLGVPLTLFIIYIRRAIYDPTLLVESHSTIATIHAYKWIDLIRPMTQAIRLVSFGAVYFYVILVWMPFYLNYFSKIQENIARFNNTLALCIMLLFYPIVGYLSQRWGYKRLILASTLVILLLILPLFKGIQSYSSWKILLLLQTILSLIYVGIDGVLIETLGELFPQVNRSLGFGLAWTLSATFAGGTVPLVCTYVIHKTGWLMFPAFYIMFFGLLALPVALRLKSPSNSQS